MTESQMIDFLKSDVFLAYKKKFPAAVVTAENHTGISTVSPAGDVQQLGKFFHKLWENLPDDPSIRGEAFNRICDFAEYYCFG